MRSSRRSGPLGRELGGDPIDGARARAREARSLGFLRLRGRDRSVEADAAADGTAETAALLERLMGHGGVRATMSAMPGDPGAGPILPMRSRKGDTSLRLFTTIATLGTPRDITLQELRVESFFPMDEETAATLRGWSRA